METTTIQISKETRNKIASFGQKGESYDEILRKLYDTAIKEQLKVFLTTSGDFISIEEARKEANKLWPRSK